MEEYITHLAMTASDYEDRMGNGLKILKSSRWYKKHDRILAGSCKICGKVIQELQGLAVCDDCNPF